ncbi:MAG: hypothetical protein WDM78_01150 [Puia sp.]
MNKKNIILCRKLISLPVIVQRLPNRKEADFVFTGPMTLAITVIKGLLASVPQLDPKLVDDVIVGNAVPEAEQGPSGRAAS